MSANGFSLSADLLPKGEIVTGQGEAASDGTDYMTVARSGDNLFLNPIKGDGAGIAIPGKLIGEAVIEVPRILFAGDRYILYWPTLNGLNVMRVGKDGSVIDAVPSILPTIVPYVERAITPNGALAAAGDGKGNLLVVWLSNSAGLVQSAMWLQDGTVTATQTLGTTATDSVALSYGAGGFLASWLADAPGQAAGLLVAVRLGSGGAPLDSKPFTVTSGQGALSSLTSAFNGSAHVMAFAKSGAGVGLVHVRPDGSVVEAVPPTVAAGGNLLDPHVLPRAQDDFVTWRDVPLAPQTGGGLLGRRVSKVDGTSLDGAPHVLMAAAPGTALAPTGPAPVSNGETVLVLDAVSRAALWKDGAGEPPPETTFPVVPDYNQYGVIATAGRSGYLVRYTGSGVPKLLAFSAAGVPTGASTSLVPENVAGVWANGLVAGPDHYLEAQIVSTGTQSSDLRVVRVGSDASPIDSQPKVWGSFSASASSLQSVFGITGAFGDGTYFFLVNGWSCNLAYLGGCLTESRLALLRASADGTPRDVVPVSVDTTTQFGSLVRLEDGGVALLYVTQVGYDCFNDGCTKNRWDPAKLHALRLPASGPLGDPVELDWANGTQYVGAAGGGKILLVAGSQGHFTGRMCRPDFSAASEAFTFGRDGGGSPTVVYTGSTFWVSWTAGQSAYVTRIQPEGTVLDPTGVLLSDTQPCVPAVSAAPNSALCAFSTQVPPSRLANVAHALIVTDGTSPADGGGGAGGDNPTGNGGAAGTTGAGGRGGGGRRDGRRCGRGWWRWRGGGGWRRRRGRYRRRYRRRWKRCRPRGAFWRKRGACRWKGGRSRSRRWYDGRRRGRRLSDRPSGRASFFRRAPGPRGPDPPPAREDWRGVAIDMRAAERGASIGVTTTARAARGRSFG